MGIGSVKTVERNHILLYTWPKGDKTGSKYCSAIGTSRWIF